MQRLLRLGAGLLVAALFFLALEILLAFAGFHYRPSSPILIWNRAEDEKMRQTASLHRIHPYWFWELRAGAPVPDCPGERINDAGFRGPLRQEALTPGVTRIVALGDSSTFGMGVCAAEAYSANLESLRP